MLASALVIYTITDSHCDYGFVFFNVVMASIYMKCHIVLSTCGITM